jgi:hypothetical protein
MAENIPITPGTGDVVAADDIAGVKHQRIKLVLGADGVSDGDVSSSNPMPVSNVLESSATGALTSVSNSTSSVSVLAANANRKGFIIHNDSNTNVFVAFSATSSTSAFTLRLTNQSSYFSNTLPIYRGVISAIATAAAGSLRITELT